MKSNLYFLKTHLFWEIGQIKTVQVFAVYSINDLQNKCSLVLVILKGL